MYATIFNKKQIPATLNLLEPENYGSFIAIGVEPKQLDAIVRNDNSSTELIKLGLTIRESKILEEIKIKEIIQQAEIGKLQIIPIFHYGQTHLCAIIARARGQESSLSIITCARDKSANRCANFVNR
jgi:hypothetical protein